MANNKVESIATENTSTVGAENAMNVFENIGGIVSTYEGENIQQMETKGGKLVQSKEYKFINPIGKRASLKTFDSDIIQSTEKIALALRGQSILTFAICRELSKINTPKKLESMGFKSIAEYGSALFDFSRVTCTQYARIGEIFIGDDYRIKSDIIPASLTKGHFVELLTAVGENNDISDIEEMYLNNTLTDGMSTNAMRKAIKEWKNTIDSPSNELPDNGEEISELPENAPSDKKEGKTASGEKSDTGEKETSYDIQKEVGKALSTISDLEKIISNMVNNGSNINGYEPAINDLKAMLTALI